MEERSNMMTRPSEPPVTSVVPDSWSCPTSAVWPWRRARHSPVLGDQTRTVESSEPVIMREPLNAME